MPRHTVSTDEKSCIDRGLSVVQMFFSDLRSLQYAEKARNNTLHVNILDPSHAHHVSTTPVHTPPPAKISQRFLPSMLSHHNTSARLKTRIRIHRRHPCPRQQPSHLLQFSPKVVLQLVSLPHRLSLLQQPRIPPHDPRHRRNPRLSNRTHDPAATLK